MLCYLRLGFETDLPVLAAFNFTPVVRRNYRVGVPLGGEWKELLNSDAPIYGGSGQGNFGQVESVPFALAGPTALDHDHAAAIGCGSSPAGRVVYFPAEFYRSRSGSAGLMLALRYRSGSD